MPHRILIVDDEAEARFSLPLPLEDAGYDVITAADGQDALEQIEAAPDSIDGLILDIEMPRMNGLQLLDALIERDILLPCIVISGYGDKATIIELLRRGVDDFLDKPFNQRDLLSTLEAVLKKWLQRQHTLTSITRPKTDDFPFDGIETDQTTAPSAPPQEPEAPSADDGVDETSCEDSGWQIDNDGERCALHLLSGLDAADADSLRHCLLHLLDTGSRRFSCSMKGLDDLHPILLSVLLRFADLLHEQHLPPLQLHGFGEHLSQFFHITNAVDQFHISLEDLP